MNRCAECWVREPRWSTGRIAGVRVDGEPEPQHLFGAEKSRAQFIELQVWEVQMSRWDRSCKICACTGCTREKGS